jgi:hypothetical protein
MNNGFSVTTGLMMAFAAFVIFTRLRNWLDSNVPVMFYVALLIYAKWAADISKVPWWLVLASLALGLTLRFEFMNPFFTKAVKFLEIAALCLIIYLLFSTLVG